MMIQITRTPPKIMMNVQLPPKDRDAIGEPLAKSQLLVELFADVLGENFVCAQTLDHLLIERGKLADFILEDFFDVIAAEFPEVLVDK